MEKRLNMVFCAAAASETGESARPTPIGRAEGYLERMELEALCSSVDFVTAVRFCGGPHRSPNDPEGVPF
jgi:hypothetical protein